MSASGASVWDELSMGLVDGSGPEQAIVPLMAGLHYASADPYAIRVAFYAGTGEPVEWALSRDLLAAALVSPQGTGDVRAWPSAAPGGPAAGGAWEGAAAGLLHLEVSSPSGRALFQASAAAVAVFLEKTYAIVPAGRESDFLDLDAELAELLGQP
jgi:Streptomyces sporulation and cell division protein, SsgA